MNLKESMSYKHFVENQQIKYMYQEIHFLGGKIIVNLLSAPRTDKAVHKQLEEDEADLFLEEVRQTHDIWENCTSMTKDILKHSFGSPSGQISYIISLYF